MIELGKTLGIERRKTEVFELLAKFLHPQTVSKRRVDIESLLGDAALLVGRHASDSAHVVQAVGELDDEHAQISCHRDQHLAHGGGLLRLFRVELQALELGNAIDNCGDIFAELLLYLGNGDLGVFDCVVQKRSSK